MNRGSLRAWIARALMAGAAGALFGPAAGACGGGHRDVIPRLPGDGVGNTAAPREAGSGSEVDLWAGHDTIDPPRPLSPKPLDLPPMERFTLESGLQVIAIESRSAPTFMLQLAVKSGRQSEPREKVGLASFVASMLPRGARGRSGAQMSAALEQAGAQLTSNASYEALLITCHAPAAGQAVCLRAVGDMVIAPGFPASAMDEVRAKLMNAARQNQQDVAQLATFQFQNALWGDEHVRGWPMTERSVAAIQRADLQAWHRSHASPKNAVLVVVSTHKAEALRPALEAAFGPWRRSAPAAAAQAREPEVKGIRIRLVDVPGARQSQIRVGGLGIAHRDPDFYAATVVNHILGGSIERSRVGRALRRSQGVQAGASTTFDRNLEKGAFVAAGAAPTGQTVAVVRLLMEQINQMAADGPREEEVKSAATELAGSYLTRLSSHQDMASALLAAELHGLGADYVRNYAVELSKVDAAAAKASASRWLDGKNLVVVVTGSAQELEPQLREAGLHYDKVAGPTGDRPGQRAGNPAAVAQGAGNTAAGQGAASSAVAQGAGNAAVAQSEREATQKEATAPVDPKKEAAARALLDGALAAKGGAGKLGAVKSLSWKGKATLKLPGGQVPAQVEKRFVAPDKLRLDMVIEAGGAKMSITTVLAGDRGWAQEVRPDGVNSIDFPPREIEAGKTQIWRDQDFVLLRHREKGARVAPLDDVELDGVPHSAVQVTSADGTRSVTLFLDKKSKRLGGMSYSEQGVTAQESFGDYKVVNGVEIAHRRATHSAQVDLTTTITEVKLNLPIDASIFVKPASKSGATPAPAGPQPGAQPAPGPAATPPAGSPGAPATTPPVRNPAPAGKPVAPLPSTPGSTPPPPPSGQRK